MFDLFALAYSISIVSLLTFTRIALDSAAELPFVTAHVWTYLPDAAHYLPLQGDGLVAQIFRTLLPQANDNLAISYLSAPCYFAVTMDAIALGRWFQEP